MVKLVLARHGQSVWNLENRFTGWVDVDLTEQGLNEAKSAGEKLKDHDISIDLAFTSPLKRAKRTCALIKEYGGYDFSMQEYPEIIERFYGGLTGLNKAETAQEFGENQVKIWRRSYDIQPPALQEDDDRHPSNNGLFSKFPFKLPATESLKDVVNRVKPFYDTILLSKLKAEKNLLIVAHGNSIRAIIKLLEQLDEEQIRQVEIATATPIIYDIDYDDQGVKINSKIEL